MKKDTIIKTRTLNVRIPSELIEWIDSLVDNKIYNSRSEVIRNLIREYLENK
ncbi:MAG: ribbon-helix-helix domain-containing protein [Candidatus Woesearchaeota archaeon]